MTKSRVSRFARLATAALGLSVLGIGLAPTTASAATGIMLVQSATWRCLDSNYYGEAYTRPCSSSNSYQRWTATSKSELKNVATGACLTATGNLISTSTCYGSTNQIWTEVPASNGSSVLFNKRSGLVLDGNAAGAVYALASNGGAYQRWVPASS
ncbi:RICIN domain-containing protein [Streptomyces paludis]|nr:RICIN domain-containing protein [Streptomyces paludis]